MAVPDIEFTSDPFLPGNVQDLMESGEFDTDVEIIIGTNADDGMLFVLGPLLFPILFEEFKNSFNYSAPMALFDVSFVTGKECIYSINCFYRFTHLDNYVHCRHYTRGHRKFLQDF